MFNRGLCKTMMDEYDGAILDFTKYIILVLGDGDGYSQRGEAKKFAKDTAGCLNDYDTCLVLTPNNYAIRVERGRIYGIIDSMELSLSDFNYAYSIDSNRYKGIYLKAVTHYYMNQQDSAFKYFSKCVILDSLDDGVYFFMAKLKYFKRNYDNALKDINEAIKLNSKDADYYIARAKIYMFNDNEYDDDLGEDDLYTALKMGLEEVRVLLEEYFSEEE